ncbi:MAG TPA: serine hydrolase domain-containing protein [Acidimicrobiales bacterium]|jgi:CubicO group peptidase (beta-lactamase class C family)|nr:serine hydrolase domain-containing protein [Acidimicrobiales bacterium]
MTASLSKEPVDPGSVGIHPGRLGVLIDRVRQDVLNGPLPSAQIAVAIAGHVVAFETFGDARSSTRYITQSAGRPLLGACVWKLMSDGLLDVDQPVASVLAPFGSNGKEKVTYRHVLTHTGGFPMAPIRYPAMTDRAQRLDAMARWRLDYEPGTAMQYHLTSAAWVIADTVEELSGLPLRQYLREKISDPLGLDIELGVPPERQAGTVAPIVAIGSIGPDWKPDPWGPWFFQDPEVLAAGEPSHTICSSALDTVLLFQAMYYTDMFSPDVIAFATGPVAEMTMSGNYGTPGATAVKGLFVNIEGPPTASVSTWGHGGAPSSLTWHDPEVGLSVAFYNNGYPATGYDVGRSGRNRSTVVSALAGDLIDD